MEIKKTRGVLTEEIKLKYGITQEELRLIPYLHYCIINNQRLDLEKLTRQEVKILLKWENEGFIIASFEDPCVITSRRFWDIMSDVLFDAYATRYE